MPTTTPPAGHAPAAAFATTKIDLMSTAAPEGADPAGLFDPSDVFAPRHIGPSEHEIGEMLGALGYRTLEELTDATVPEAIRLRRALNLAGLSGRSRGEHEVLADLHAMANENKVFRSFIGMGYYGTITPPVILRNILENPGWYTQYTPYQAEIAQGRLEALLNFQTMVADLTGLPLAGASLLDEATAAAEAMAMCAAVREGRTTFLAADDCHPQTLAVMKTRAESMGLDLRIVPVPPALRGEAAAPTQPDMLLPNPDQICGVLVQYPTTSGTAHDYRPLVKAVHGAGALVVMATDLLALTLLTPPGELGADIAVGSAQRFGVPMGAGGPHAAFISTRPEFVRKMPGRIIGVSRDALGNTAFRMAIQTREQHIKREKATSNICTAQALLAIIAGMYAAYHGPGGLRRIAERIRGFAGALAGGVAGSCEVEPGVYFDTLRLRPLKRSTRDVLDAARAAGINLRDFGDGTIGVSFDETTTRADLAAVVAAVTGDTSREGALPEPGPLPAWAARTSTYLTHPVFESHHSEHEMLRYIFRLQGRDLSLAHSMISLGSCTMKLNATSEMIPVTWREFGQIHPFAPADQQRGYARLYRDLEAWLSEITGFASVSLQPNAGSQGEYAGLCVIHAYHQSRGDTGRDICLIPESAHGTNPASAIIAGLRVVPVACDEKGNIDLADLRAKAQEHKAALACLMVTYPSTYGVFEESIREICVIIHIHGGQVYMDGANMNAQVGLCRPGDIGADVCHLNLHKTFCIPHGGGGPGMGPIGVAAHLAPFLPGHPVVSPFAESGRRSAHGAHESPGSRAIGPVSAAPYGSPSILPISWMYIALMGAAGLKKATQVAILSANYMAKRLAGHYPMLFTGRNGRNAHEFIVDCRAFDKSAGIKVDDIAKRLMDYGFHAPTMSFPVPGTLMIEPTESEPKEELDRFVDAMIAIRAEIRAIEDGAMDRADNPLKNAPHTAPMVTATQWKHPYTREQAAYPLPWVRDRKFWPHVARIDNPFGDRNLVCACPPMNTY